MEKSSTVSGSRARGIQPDSDRGGNPENTMVCVISYSLTGNNDALAASLAQALAAKHVRVTEPGKRSMATILTDLAFKRTPRVQAAAGEIERYDLVLFVGPVWMGQIATPLRACFRELRSRVPRYAFVSICGGADGPNPGLAGELRRRLARDPAAVVELPIADLLPPEPRPRRRDTMAHRVNQGEVARLTDAVVEALPRHSAERSKL